MRVVTSRLGIFSPWASFWTEPFRTIQRLLDSPKAHRQVILVSLLYSIPYAVEQSISSVPSAAKNWTHFLLLVPTGFIFGLLLIGLIGYCLKVAGGWFGGTGSTRDLCIANAFCWLPLFLSFPINLWLLISKNDLIGASDKATYILLELFMVLAYLSYHIPAVAAAHRMTRWRGFFAMVLGHLLLATVIICAYIPYYYLYVIN